MPWWGWCLTVFLGLVLLLRNAMKFSRKCYRKEMLAFLKERHPDIEVIREQERALTVRTPDGSEGELLLGNVYAQLVTTKVDDVASRQPIYEQFFGGMIDDFRAFNQPLSLDTAGTRLLPRIVNDATRNYLNSLGSDAKNVVPSLPLEGTPLHVVFVLDAPTSVRYVNQNDLQDLGIDVTELRRLTYENLSKIFPTNMVRKVIDDNAMINFKAMDAHDASRLLLVSQHLNPGESVVALIPDRDTLVLGPAPQNDDWSAYRKLAKTPASDKLIFDGVLRVTSSGLEVV